MEELQLGSPASSSVSPIPSTAPLKQLRASSPSAGISFGSDGSSLVNYSEPPPVLSPRQLERAHQSHDFTQALPGSSKLPSLDDLEDIEPLPPAGRLSTDDGTATSDRRKSIHFLDETGGSAGKSNQVKDDLVASPQSSYSSPAVEPVQYPTAQYVTVSAILSRSGAIFPIGEVPEQGRDLFSARRRPSRSYDSGDESVEHADSSLRRRRLRKQGTGGAGAASSGNALEALGTLLLNWDHAGRAPNLSSQRWKASAIDNDGAGNSQQRRRRTSGDSSSDPRSLAETYKSFLRGLRNVGASTLSRIQLPSASAPGTGDTIAERRARKRGGEVVIGDDGQISDFIRVRSRRNQPTFEVSRPPSPEDTRFQNRPRKVSDPIADPRTAFRRSKSATNASLYGIGSSFGMQDPPEVPPSPLGMPGDWPGGRRWRRGADESDEDWALLLPPPLLDDRGSNAASFETLLGVSRQREREEARRKLEQLTLRNRPLRKKGLLTAVGNFVKAAHAAEQASKLARTGTFGARPTGGMIRRHTEGFEGKRDRDFQKVKVREPNDLHQEEIQNRSERPPYGNTRNDPLRQASDTQGHSLSTVYEGQSSNATSKASVTKSPPPITLSRRSSVASRDFMSQPHAPRLLPIQLSAPPSPLVANQGGAVGRKSTDSGIRTPFTPRLGPTMLSLPPSPWTSFDQPLSLASPVSEDAAQQQPFSLSLLTMTTPRGGPPGTPRLSPLHLEILPSPFPTEKAAPPGEVAAVASPVSMASFGEMATSTLQSSLVAASGDGAGRRQLSDGQTAPAVSSGPSIGFKDLPDGHSSGASDARASADFEEEASTQAAAVHATYPAENVSRRSFILWWLVGNLGLGLRASLSAKAHDPTLSTQRHLAWVGLAEVFDFFSFCAIPLRDLLYEIAGGISVAAWFISWLFLNLTGRTVLSRCIIEAYQLIRDEWSVVALEDHENRRGAQGLTVESDFGKKVKAKGFSRWQVCRGIVELICLQAVTRERWLEEGAGLQKLDGWQKSKAKPAQQESPARAFGGALSDESSSDDELEDDTDLIVTRRDADILEFTRTPRIRPRTSVDEGGGDAGYFGKAVAHRIPSNGRASVGEHKSKTKLRDLVKTIRWASRLAIGAYGLHVHIVDLPPTFTPSGNRFSRQTFAHLSRLSDPNDVLHADIQQMGTVVDDSGEHTSYQPTFYVARDHVRKMIVVAVRGTQSFSDIIADLDMRTSVFPLPTRPGNGSPSRDEESTKHDAQMTCHAGVLRAAQGLIQEDSTLFKTLSTALTEHQDFGLTFVGHSLGAAIGCAVALLLAEYVDEQKVSTAETAEGSSSSAGSWRLHPSSGLPAGRPIQVISFAPPATFSSALATFAAQGGDSPLVTSVVLGGDIIPRAGHGQARELRRVLGALSRVRRRKKGKRRNKKGSDDKPSLLRTLSSASGYLASRRGSLDIMDEEDEKEGEDEGQPDDIQEDDDARVHIVRRWWRWRSLCNKIEQGTAGSAEKREKVAIEKELWYLRRDVESDLYSAIKRRSAGGSDQTDEGVDGNQPSAAPPTPWLGPRSAQPLHKITARRQELLDRATLQSEAALGGIMIPAGRVIYIEEGTNPIPPPSTARRTPPAQPQTEPASLYHVLSPLSFFSLAEFRSDLFAAHLPASYESVIEDL